MSWKSSRVGGVALAVILPTVLVGGCATEQAYSDQAGWYAGGPRDVAVVAPKPVPVEMEDDGREAQLPPRVDSRALPDDPREPWSRNYGGPATARRPEPRAAQSATIAPTVAHRVSWMPQH